MANQKYLELVKVYPEWHTAMSVLQNIKSDCLKPCAVAFEANMLRISDFGLMPAEITFDRMRDGVIAGNAYFAVTGKMDRTLRMVLLEGVKVAPEEMVKVSEQLREFMQWTEDERNRAFWRVGVMTVEKMATVQGPMITSIHAMFTSVILESWLFFESLAADLWAAGVDNGGSKISGRIRLNRSWEKSEEKVSDIPQTQADPKTQPGSFYCETGMVSFQKFRSIRDYFAIAFGNSIKSALDDSANGYIYALAAFRNCIAHSAGRIDTSFLKQAERFSEFKGLPLRSQLPLDGEIAAKLRNAAMITGAALIQKVDEMLQAGD